MWELIQTYRKYDPATKSSLEVFFLYPGVKAIGFHRLAHALYRAGIPFVPRAISEWSRFLTGIDIHPGARIGKNLIIDHGMGVVIGETAEVGDHCLIFHGVTLGGVDFSPVKRHPTLGNHVVVGAGAKILGNITIGDHARIGANSVVIKSVPEHCTATGIPAKVVNAKGVVPGEELKHDQID
jgi:serine O-acetyltransferase